MNAFAAIGGGIGGIVALITAVWIIARGIARQVNATEDTTKAVQELQATVKEMGTNFQHLNGRVATLEGQMRNR